MTKDVRLEVSEEQHEWLTELKNERGYTWKGLLLEGRSASTPTERSSWTDG